MSQKSILLIDDDAFTLETLKDKLSEFGYAVTTSESASEAFDLLTKHFDLIITDVVMPTLSGLEFLKVLKNRMMSETPIIVISGAGNPEIVYEALEAGAVDFLEKPVSETELKIRVEKPIGKAV